MKPANAFVVVLVTAPDLKTARHLARGALTEHLVACANLIPGIESHYWWRDQLEQDDEILMVMKTTTDRLPMLEKLILEQHPYDTPEIVALPLQSGTPKYLDWLAASTTDPNGT